MPSSMMNYRAALVERLKSARKWRDQMSDTLRFHDEMIERYERYLRKVDARISALGPVQPILPGVDE